MTLPTSNWQPPARLKDQAYEAIKKLLLWGAFAPGTFLSERQLAAELNMSKTPVRSAVERLEYEGYLSISPNHGIAVRELSLQEIADHFDIRTALETHTVKKLAGYLSDEQVRALEQNLRAQADSLEADDGLHLAKLDIDYHLLLCRFAENAETLRVMKHELEVLFRIVVQLSTRNRRQASHQEHSRVLGALLTGDADGAVEFVKQHLDFGRHFWGRDG